MKMLSTHMLILAVLSVFSAHLVTDVLVTDVCAEVGKLGRKDEARSPTMAGLKNAEVRRLAAGGEYIAALSVFKEIKEQDIELQTVKAVSRSAEELGLESEVKEMGRILVTRFNATKDEEAEGALRLARLALERSDYAGVSKQTSICYQKGSADMKAVCALLASNMFEERGLMGQAISELEKYVDDHNLVSSLESASVSNGASNRLSNHSGNHSGKDLKKREGSEEYNNQLLLRLGMLLYDGTEFERAQDILASISMDADEARLALEILARIEYRNGKHELAVKLLREGERRFGELANNERVNYLLLSALVGCGKIGEAASLLESLKQRTSENNTYYILSKATFEKHNAMQYLDSIKKTNKP